MAEEDVKQQDQDNTVDFNSFYRNRAHGGDTLSYYRAIESRHDKALAKYYRGLVDINNPDNGLTDGDRNIIVKFHRQGNITEAAKRLAKTGVITQKEAEYLDKNRSSYNLSKIDEENFGIKKNARFQNASKGDKQDTNDMLEREREKRKAESEKRQSAETRAIGHLFSNSGTSFISAIPLGIKIGVIITLILGWLLLGVVSCSIGML